MTFREAMENYRAGTASEAERLLVEQELEKSRLISEYLDEQLDEPMALPTPPMEEIKQLRRNLRRRNALIVLTSLVLAAVLLWGTVSIGIPAAESQYWNPTIASYGTTTTTDLELMLAAYTELLFPDVNISSVNITKTGFAAYDLSIQYWNSNRGGSSLFSCGTVERGELTLPVDFLSYCPMNIFERATYPSYPADKSSQQAVRDKLSMLPEYVTVVAAVSFPEDKSMAELLEFQNSLIDGQIGWTAIRHGSTDEQILPLCGMNPFPWGTVRTAANTEYPCLDLTALEKNPENLEAHFKSLLRFSADQTAKGTGIPEEYRRGRCYYTDVLEYVEEHGVYSYGCYVRGTPETLLSLLESGAVSHVWITDLWIGA